MGILRDASRYLAIVLAIAAWPGFAAANCQADAAELRGAFGAVSFKVEIADSVPERSKGLMFVEQMGRFNGMLFLYDRERPLAFWMRNTLIPLDMIFLDSTGTIVHIHENAVPLDETPIPSPVPALAVLEINGGMSSILGLKVGDQLRHPDMPQKNAAWPCI